MSNIFESISIDMEVLEKYSWKPDVVKKKKLNQSFKEVSQLKEDQIKLEEKITKLKEDQIKLEEKITKLEEEDEKIYEKIENSQTDEELLDLTRNFLLRIGENHRIRSEKFQISNVLKRLVSEDQIKLDNQIKFQMNSFAQFLKECREELEK